MNSLSELGLDGLRLSRRNCSMTRLSMTLRLGVRANTSSGITLGQGEVMRAKAICPEYQTLIAPSP